MDMNPQQPSGQPAAPGQPPQQPTPQQPQMPPQQQPSGSNTMAILGLVFAILFWPAGIALSIIGLNKSKQLNGAGKGLAIAGIVVSIAMAILGIVMTVVMITGMTRDDTSTESSQVGVGFESQRVGTGELGFVSIPEDWVRSHVDSTAGVTSAILYHDAERNKSVTIMAYEASELTAREVAEFTADMFNIAAPERSTEIPGITSYRTEMTVMGESVTAFFFVGNDGRVRYLAVSSQEGMTSVLRDIIRSYSFTR